MNSLDDCLKKILHFKKTCNNQLGCLQQNSLMNEAKFINFAKSVGIEISGNIKGDPSDFLQRGWLSHDDIDQKKAPLFHPFRIYVICQILNFCKIPISISSSLNRDCLSDHVKIVARNFMLPLDQIADATTDWNLIVDLAIILEPVYWPEITGKYSFSGFLSERHYHEKLGEYREEVIKLVKTLDIEKWSKYHEQLRLDAHSIDSNKELYLLLRTAGWDARNKLTGQMAGALWIRHMAEVIRRGFEETHNSLRLLEEDRAHEQWMKGARISTYGSERPLDDILQFRPRIAAKFKLFTSSTVRWYVEGETEFYAILGIINDPAKSGIELINLRGNLATDKGNIAMKLHDNLIADRALRRFSIISFDTDEKVNKKTIRREIRDNNIIGYIAAHTPDFEFANFALQELVDIAAEIDEKFGYSGNSVRREKWHEINSARKFEERYLKVSERKPRALKGEEWGKALADYAWKHPSRSDNQAERLLIKTIKAAFQTRSANYDLQQSRFCFDDDYNLVKRA